MADFKLIQNPLNAPTKACNIASATVIEAGDAVSITAGLLVKGIAASATLGIAAGPSAAGETDLVPVWNDSSMVFSGTGDAAFAATQRSTEVDLVGTTTQLIDVGTSATNVFKIEPGDNAGTVGSTAKILVRLNKTL